MRLQKNQENTKFESEELISVSGVFYKPASEDVCGQVFGLNISDHFRFKGV